MRSLEQRLRNLEGRLKPSDAVLIFADGTSRGVRIARKRTLRLFMDAMHLNRFFFLRAHPKYAEGELPTVKPDLQYENVVRLFGAAARLEAKNRFLVTIWGVCVEAMQFEAEISKNVEPNSERGN